MSQKFAVRTGSLADIGANVEVTGCVMGVGNRLVIEGTNLVSKINIEIIGDNNTVLIGEGSHINGLTIRVGNHVPANNVTLKVGYYFTSEPDCKFFLPNSGNTVEIGDERMLSNSIIIRAGESPHLLFDAVTGRYIDVSDGVFIGNHVWIGERVYITKRATIADECVVAACSVVTKRFEEPNCVIAGNPAKIARRQVQWIRNRSKLVDGEKFHAGFMEHWGASEKS